MISIFLLHNHPVFRTRANMIDSVEINSDGTVLNRNIQDFDNKRIVIPVSNYTIKNVYFSYFSSADNGGCIYFYLTQGFNLIMEDILFYCCYSSLSGGAIHIQTTIVLNNLYISMICANNCSGSSSSNGQYAYIYTHYNGTNVLEYQSVSYCSRLPETRSNCIQISRGINSISNNNFSYNTVRTCSSFNFYSAHLVDFSYNTIIRNNCTNANCILVNNFMYNTSSNSRHFHHSIIYYNNCPSSTNGVIETNNNVFILIQDCIFLDNSGFLFNAQTSSRIDVRNCWINHNDPSFKLTSSTTAVVQVLSCTIGVQNTQTFALSHFSSYGCETIGIVQLDMTPCQTIPPLPTPVQTPEATKECECSNPSSTYIQISTVLQCLIALINTQY